MNLSLISKKIREYPILFACCIISPLALALLFMRGPKIEQYQTELEELEREWNDIQKNLERSAGLEEDIERLDAGLEQIESRLMRVEDVANNYEFFYGLEEKGNIELLQFNQGAASNGENLPTGIGAFRHFSVIPYNLTMSGTMSEVLGFLDLLDRQEYIVRMDMFRLSPGSNAQVTAQDNGEGRILTGRLACHVLAEKNE